MSDERVSVEVSKARGIIIRAPVDVAEAELLEAARFAHHKARSRLAPNRDRIADEMGFRAYAARASGATWARVTDDLSDLLGRDLDVRQVRRWAQRWEQFGQRLNDAHAGKDTTG